jgi:hypothetical protein
LFLLSVSTLTCFRFEILQWKLKVFLSVSTLVGRQSDV